jgi:hypothetical protein
LRRPLWCADTNVFINAWNRLYAPDFAPAYWARLAALSASGQLFVSEEVREELAPADDDLFRWAKDNIAFYPITEEVQAWVSRVMADHGKLVALGGTRSRADPFVIGTAGATASVVVTTEGYGTAAKPKIPYVCDQLGIGHIDLTQFIRAERIFL